MQNKINRVVLVGTGAVGCSYAYYMISQGAAEEIILIDANRERKRKGRRRTSITEWLLRKRR